MLSEKDFYKQAFARNIGILAKDEQEKLKKAKIAIVGLGGVGGAYLLNFIRIGVANFHIADFDNFELANINRQAGAGFNSLSRPKIEVMEEMAKAINPFVFIRKFPEAINEKNVNEFLEGVDALVDGIDFFNIKDRLAIFKRAREKNIYAITSPPIGFGASLLVFSPKGMTFERYFDIKENMTEKEKLLSFAIGLSPSLIHRRYFKTDSIDFSGQSASTLVCSTLLCANLVITEAVKIILGKKVKTAPFSIQFDPYVQKCRKVYLLWGNKNPVQIFKKWYIKKKLKKMNKI